MPPKKKAAKAKAEPVASEAPNTTAEHTQDIPATEIAEPPKDDAQPASGSLKEDTTEADEAVNVNETTADAPVDSKTAPATKPATSSKKRKQTAKPEASSKTARRSSRAPKSELTQQRLIKYLLSKDAEELLRPGDEKRDMEERGEIRTYSSSALNPFEELMCSMILARPISHTLGLRSIRTVLNEPYNFTSAQAVKNAGEERRLQAMVDARTQHKGKTADQLGQAAETILEKFTADDDKEGTQLGKALSDHKDDVDQTLKSLKESINGLGDKGLDIFLRRVQWLEGWQEGYPYADGLSRDGLRNIGLTQDVDELRDAIQEHWSDLDTQRIAGDDETAKQRRALVIVLERATGAHLENKINDVRIAAAED